TEQSRLAEERSNVSSRLSVRADFAAAPFIRPTDLPKRLSRFRAVESYCRRSTVRFKRRRLNVIRSQKSQNRLRRARRSSAVAQPYRKLRLLSSSRNQKRVSRLVR